MTTATVTTPPAPNEPRPPLTEGRIADLAHLGPSAVEATARLLHEAFLGRSDAWQDLPSAREEVEASLAPDRWSRVARSDTGEIVGWVGAMPTYGERVWELHPLVVAPPWRRRGVGRALVEDLERGLASRGATSIWLGSDDENGETNASGVDLWSDLAGAIRDFRPTGTSGPHGFWLRLGFCVVGLMPDANGAGRPDVYFGKPLRPRSTEDGGIVPPERFMGR